MPTDITTRALPNGTFVITVAFFDDDGSAVTPNDPTTWSLKDTAGNIINSREDVAITEDTTVDIVLQGADLAATGVNDDGIRILSVDGTYDSDAGSDLPLDNSSQFVVDTLLPVSLQEAKRQVSIVSTNTDHDFRLAQCITAAREAAEKFTKRRLLTQTVTAYLNEWPEGDEILLPYGNLISVTSVKYKDTDGNQSTFSSNDYIVETNTHLGKIVLGYGEVWPTVTLYPTSPIEIEYSCGYGAHAGDVPAMIRHAIKLGIADLFENHEPSILGQGFTYVQTKMVERLLYPYKLWTRHHAIGTT